jgi:hypothetical protein
MYRITAEHMTKARSAAVVAKAAGKVIFWEESEVFKGVYRFYCGADATPQEVYDIQGFVYEQNGGASAAVEKLSAEEAREYE